MGKDLIIWVPAPESPYGFNTMKFNNVTNFSDDGREVSFEYDGVATKKHRAATFSRLMIIGHALTEDDNGD